MTLATSIIDQAARSAPKAPRERGILFSPEMVVAILAGRKVQTRRILNPSDVEHIRYMGCEEHPDGGADRENDAVIQFSVEGHSGPGMYVSCSEYPEEGSTFIRCPYGIPGDILNVRETWAAERRWDACAPSDIPPGSPVHYFANGPAPEWCGKGRPSIFLPAWASRLKLLLTEVRIERLQAISEEDARAEGVEPRGEAWIGAGLPWASAKAAFAALWGSINNARAPWSEDPWIWALRFSRITPATHQKGP